MVGELSESLGRVFEVHAYAMLKFGGFPPNKKALEIR